MSIIEDEASEHWDGSRGISEFSYFEMGFDKAVALVGSCFECEYKNNIDDCSIGELIKEVSLHSFYCATFTREMKQ